MNHANFLSSCARALPIALALMCSTLFASPCGAQVVRDHRAPPVVRDHRTPPIVRDHRTPPIVRDHRTPPVEGKYLRLAAHWAPVLCQDMDSDNYRAEYITRFDYDGNWRGNDNWNHLNGFDLPGAIYYWVTETQTHYFIGYAFFHPRDWSSKGILQHENDLEGILVTVKKPLLPVGKDDFDVKKENEFGQFVALSTVAHLDFWNYTDKDEAAGPSRSVTNNYEKVNGDVDFVSDDFGWHPVLYVQSEGHGVYANKSGEGVGILGDHVTDYPKVFDDNKVTDWRGANWNGIVKPPRSGRVTTSYDTNDWNDGIIYHYEGVADVPGRANQTAKNQLPHEFQVVGYNLVSMQELWDRRDDWETTKETYDHYGTFDGTNGSPDSASAPWSWNDNDDGPVYPLDFFYDPAYLVDRYFDGLGAFSHVYTGNSYDSHTHTLETQQPFSTQDNYKRKWVLQLPGAENVILHLDRLNFPDSNVSLTVRDARGFAQPRRFSGPSVIATEQLIYIKGNTVIVSLEANGENKRFGFRLHLTPRPLQ